MSNNKKTLLILSGCNGVADIIRYAKSKGIYTVATDYYKDRGEKVKADKYYNISTTNINAILDIAKKHKVNGVTTGTSESSMHTVMNVTKILGLPFYANEDTLEKINNKRILSGLGDLIDYNNKATIRQNLKKDTIALLKLYKEFPIKG